MGEVRNGDQEVRKYLFSEIFYGRQAVFYEDFFSRIIWIGGVKKMLEKFRQEHILKVSNRLYDPRVFFKTISLRELISWAPLLYFGTVTVLICK